MLTTILLLYYLYILIFFGFASNFHKQNSASGKNYNSSGISPGQYKDFKTFDEPPWKEMNLMIAQTHTYLWALTATTLAELYKEVTTKYTKIKKLDSIIWNTKHTDEFKRQFDLLEGWKVVAKCVETKDDNGIYLTQNHNCCKVLDRNSDE